jgi:hypothetical protein
MHKHFFAYSKWQDGKPTSIQIEIIVALSVTRQEARRIADEEVRALIAGQQTVDREGLNKGMRRIERGMSRRLLTTYTFRGAN